MPDRQEESLIDEMRAAIRADRERAAARAERAPAPEPEAAAEPPPPLPPRPFLRRLLGR